MDEQRDRQLADAFAGQSFPKPGSQPTRGRVEVASIIASIIDQRRQSKQEADAARRRAQVERRAARQRRSLLLQQWTLARSILRTAVAAVDAELAACTCYLSMSDDTAVCSNLAAVEIRLFVDGHPCATTLDLTVKSDGRQVHADLGLPRFPFQGALPPIGSVTREDYCATILGYVERVLRNESKITIAAICSQKL